VDFPRLPLIATRQTLPFLVRYVSVVEQASLETVGDEAGRSWRGNSTVRQNIVMGVMEKCVGEGKTGINRHVDKFYNEQN
jgi:hypothetical protein